MAIELRQVTKQVDAQTHIYQTDLNLHDGGFNVLLGTTLSGKTTLMRLMAGLEKPTTGEVWFDGRNVTGVPVQKRSVAMVYQQFINYPNFSVFDNIASPLRVARIPALEVTRRVEEIADLLKLGSMLQRQPDELSGGQQQRTALARALVKNASLVLLDEPLANLDYKLREELRDELPKLFADTGATVVYATSEPLEALMLGGYTATLDAGQVTQYGPTSAIYRAPNTLTSAKVFSDPPINTAKISKQGNKFHLGGEVSWSVSAALESLADGEYTIAVRPHHLTHGEHRPGAVQIKGTVRVAEISGSESIVRITAYGNDWVSESRGVHAFEVGDVASFDLQCDRCLVFDDQSKLIAQ